MAEAELLAVGRVKSLRRLGRMLATVVAVLCANVTPGFSQQCTYTVNSADVSDTTNHIVKFTATTTQDYCGGRTARAEGWISGSVFDNCDLTEIVGSTCRTDKTDGETNATMLLRKAACGPWSGLSNHSLWTPYVEVQLNRPTTLNGGDCGPPPNCDYCGGNEECMCDCNGGEWMPPIEGGSGWCNGDTPILISLNRESEYLLTSEVDGVPFDLNGDGMLEQVSWTDASSDVAFLAMDRDGDGAITSGKELFGNNTLPGVTNGFIALRQMAMETNGNVMRGSVSSDDPIFKKLLLWTDSNHNGISEPSELRRADELLSAVGLGYTPNNRRDKHGNRFLFEGWAHRRTAPGKNRPKTALEDKTRSFVIWDVAFRTAVKTVY